MASFAFRVTRGAFALADHIAPSLAGVMAFSLFSRTRHPGRLSAGERKAVEAAAPFMALARHHRLKPARGCVVAHEFRPAAGASSAGTALVIHGWHSRTEHMRHAIDALLRAGLRVIALDLPGHGASSGRRLNMANAVEAVSLAAAWFGPFQAVVGHSFGGAVAINAMAGSVRGFAPLQADRLVLISAPSSMPAIFEDFAQFLSLGTRTQTALADRVQHIAGRPLAEFVGAEQLARLDVPTLVVHAPDDKEVAFANALDFEGAGGHVTLLRAPGLGHRRVLADAHVVERVAAFAWGLEETVPARAA